MLTGVDHLVIRCSNPIDLMETVRAELDVPVLFPAREYDNFCSGIIRLGNLDIEFLRLGTEHVPKPYFYGIAFASAEGIWNTAAWLKTLQIPHTLPIHTAIVRDGRQWGWSTILLDGFLDKPIPAPYTLGMLSGDGLIARGVSAFSTTKHESSGNATVYVKQRGRLNVFCLPLRSGSVLPSFNSC